MGSVPNFHIAATTAQKNICKKWHWHCRGSVSGPKELLDTDYFLHQSLYCNSQYVALVRGSELLLSVDFKNSRVSAVLIQFFFSNDAYKIK